MTATMTSYRVVLAERDHTERDLTLPMFRQLDADTPMGDVDPLGRVRDPHTGDVWVIGPHRATGELMRSRIHDVRNLNPVQVDSLPGPVHVCSGIEAHDPDLGGRVTVIPVGGESLLLAERDGVRIEWCGRDCHDTIFRERCPVTWWVDDPDSAGKPTVDALNEVAAERSLHIQRHTDAAALPLILLGA